MALNLSTCIVGDIEPVRLPITNNRVSVTSAASERGIAFSIGADSQLFSGMPWINVNNTCVALVDTCGSRNNASCVAALGGVYTPPEGVQATVEQANWNGTAIAWLQQSGAEEYSDLYFNDVVKIAGYDIPGLPFYTYTEVATGDSGYSSLPLGVNSSFLEAALEIGMIGTKQWSVWMGNPDDNIDGDCILGGYDEARVAGEFTAFELDPETNSPYLLVTGIEWKVADQNPINLMPNNTRSMWALPEPGSYYVQVPEDSYYKFVDATNSSGNVFYNSTSRNYQFDDIPDGELVVTLNNGMKTTIPARDMFVHPLNYTNNGVLQVLNDSYYYDRLWPLDDPSRALYLGAPFMSQKVFVADWDAGKFHMADAVKDAQVNSNIRPLCSSTTTAPPPPPPPAPEDSGPNIPAIVGGVVGGVGGLLVIGLIAWFVLRRKKKAKQQATPEVSEPPQRISSPPPKYPTAGVYPVSDPRETYYSQSPQHMPPQEMASPPHSPAPQAASYMQSPTRSEAVGSEYWTDNPTDPSNHGEKRFTALSGPLEMPAEYDERFTRGK